MGFVPNEIWIHKNDSIKWTHAADEAHTVTFLYEPQPISPGAAYPGGATVSSGAVGCSAYGGVTAADDSAYEPSGVAGLKCVNSGALATYGVTYTVNFTAQGNFKFTGLMAAWPRYRGRSRLLRFPSPEAPQVTITRRLSWHTSVTISGT